MNCQMTKWPEDHYIHRPELPRQIRPAAIAVAAITISAFTVTVPAMKEKDSALATNTSKVIH